MLPTDTGSPKPTVVLERLIPRPSVPGLIEATVDGKNTAYFRGRKLKSRTVKVPEGYQGSLGFFVPFQKATDADVGWQVVCCVEPYHKAQVRMEE